MGARAVVEVQEWKKQKRDVVKVQEWKKHTSLILDHWFGALVSRHEAMGTSEVPVYRKFSGRFFRCLWSWLSLLSCLMEFLYNSSITGR